MVEFETGGGQLTEESFITKDGQKEVFRQDVGLKGSTNAHDKLVNVGILDRMPIYCLNSSKHTTNSSAGSIVPSIEVSRKIFNGLSQAFFSYPQHLIMYYLFQYQPDIDFHGVLH